MSSADVMQAVTARFVEMIEANETGKWVMPWKYLGSHHNMFSGHRYQGGNVMALSFAQLDKGYSSPRWATFHQWKDHGCTVRKGERGTPILFFKPIENVKVDDAGDETRSRGGMFRVFYVFNRDQVDGWIDEVADVTVVDDPLDLQLWFAAVPATVREGSPSYYPALDVVYMPPLAAFTSIEAWAGTFAHELTHWSGHHDRLNRDLKGKFGSDSYAMEELTAELGAAFICAELGLDPADRSADHGAYLASWLRVLKADSKALWSVASKASAGAAYVAESRMVLAHGSV